MKHTLCCLLQNRLGAMDRVLGALTYRGWLAEEMVSTLDPASGCLQLMITFSTDDAFAVEKLVKFLNKQVTVLEARLEADAAKAPLPAPSQSNIAFLSSPVYTQRRTANAHHA